MKFAHMTVNVLIALTGIGVATGSLELTTFSASLSLFLLALAGLLLYHKTYEEKTQ